MTTPTPTLDIDAVRRDFPILSIKVQGKPLAYLDNAATAQKPRAVIDCLIRFYEQENANIHRGVHYLSVSATDSWDRARETVARFINAAEPAECIFVRGATEAVNLVANSWGHGNIGEGDEILLTAMEHHANIVPWQLLAEKTGATIRVAPVSDEGELLIEEFGNLISPRTRLAAFTQVSNVLGTVNPVASLCRIAREHGVVTLIDGAQAAPHAPVDVQAIGCDFYVFSGHKVFGPDGIGVLYGKRGHLDAMPPWQGGGDMIERVGFEGTTFRGPPERFEAGTPNISGAIGLAVAIDYLEGIGWDAIAAHEHTLLEAATDALKDIPGIHFQGTAPGKASVVSFTIDGIHPHDIGTILDTEGVAIRAGNHCAQPLLARFGVPSTARASFAFYNTLDETERLAAAVRKTARFFA